MATDVVINEIHYNPGPGEDGAAEFLEIYNPTAAAINLNNYTVDDADSAVEGNTATLQGTIGAGEYVIITKAGFDAQARWGITPLGTVVFGLGGSGDTITLSDPNGVIVDQVSYEDGGDWPGEPDGNGPSLELIDAASDNALPGSWAASIGDPTPGEENSVDGNPPPPSIDNVVASPFSPNANQDVTVTATIPGGAASPTLFWLANFDNEQQISMTPSGGDVYTATIPDQDAGDLIRYRIEASGGRVFPEGDGRVYEGVVVADPAEIATSLVKMEWFIPEDDYDTMFDDPTILDVYVDGSVLAIDGVVYDNMTVKIRGGNYARNNFTKQGLSFDFAGGVDVDRPDMVPYPFDEFALAAERGWTWGRTSSSWQMYEAAGFAPVSGEHIRMQRNGEFYGIFRFSEKLDGTWRDMNGIDGDFYKAVSPGFNDPSQGFERKTGDESDLASISAFTSVLNAGTGSSKTEDLYDNLDIPNAVNFMAVSNLVGHFDSGSKNFYMHKDGSTGQWQVLPWDLTNTFGIPNGGIPCNNGDALEVTCLDNKLWDSIDAVPEFHDMIFRRMRTLIDGPMADGELEALFNAQDLTVSSTEQATDSAMWNQSLYRTTAQINSEVDMRRNLALASNDLPSSQSAVPGIVVTELVHSPVSGPDWLELHNPTGGSVDISGWTIDAVDLIVPGGTVLMPDSYVVFTRSVPEFMAEYPGLGNVVVIEMDGGLKGGGELVELKTVNGTVVDSVDYNSNGLWPAEPNVGVVSLSLFDPADDNSDPASWGISVAVGGTPGEENDTVGGQVDPPPEVVINEIHYNPALDLPDGVEFVELFNAEDDAVDLEGWELGGFADVPTVLPAGSEIAAGGYFVLTEDLAAFQALYPGVPAVEMASGGLGGGGDDVRLETDLAVLVDLVQYTDDPPWPGKHDAPVPSPDGEGPSLELIDPSLDNAVGENWEASLPDGGTPGMTNVEVDLEVPDSMIDDPGIVEAGVLEISGTASDDVSGVNRVRVRVRREADGKYWSGSAWVVSANTWPVAVGTESWSLAGINAAAGEYTAWAFAIDKLGKVEGWGDGRPSITFDVLAPDTTPPDTSIDDPGVLSPGLITVTGTATDNRVVDRVRVRVMRESDGKYWSGSAWVDSANTWPIADGTESWSLAGINAAAGNYSVRAYAIDEAGNIEGWAAGRPLMSLVVADDDAPPDTTITDPGEVDEGLVPISGTASDAQSGVDRVRVRVRRTADGMYWDGADWVATANTWVTAVGTESWSLAGVPVVAGEYSVRAFAIDNESNVEGWADGRPLQLFTVLGSDDTPPDTVIDDPGVLVAGVVSVTGTASDSRSDVDRVRVRVRRDSDGLFWDGTGWVAGANTWPTASGTETWSLDGVDASIAGTYRVWAYSVDVVGNVEMWADGRPVRTLTVE